MNKKITSAIQELKGSLLTMFGRDVEFKLFGSVARGDDRKYSDIDLLVLLPGKSITLSKKWFLTPLTIWN